MTNENKALLAGMFRRYGSPSDEADIRLHGWFRKAETMTNADDVQRMDERAARMIADCQEVIQQLNVFRMSLADRYGFLVSAPSVPVVRLVRERNVYDKRVYYFLRTFHRFLDGTETEESCTKYSGMERAKAIADYQRYVKEHPGITAEMDIEKGRWE